MSSRIMLTQAQLGDAGGFIEAQRAVLAEAIVARQYEQQPGLLERYGERGRAKCVEDTEYTLSFLATALAYSSGPILSEYVAWMRPMMVAFGVEREHVDEHLACVREVLRERLPEELTEQVCSIFDAAVEAADVVALASQPLVDGDLAVGWLAQQYLEALLRADRHEAMRIVLNAEKNGASVRDVYLKVFQPVQKEVGRLWQSGAITVAQEHYCTAATQLIMAQLYPRLFAHERTGRRLVAAAVEGDLHEMGLRIVTDLFQAEGWDTVYLGANVPASGVVRSIVEHKPDVVLISVTMAYHLRAAEQLIARIRAEVGEETKILIGGYPCNVDGGLWERLGADACACDAVEAIASAAALIADSSKRARVAERVPRGFEESQPAYPAAKGERAVYGELSRLNNELITAHRDLARKNAELERLQAQLKAADQRKNEFIATLAHELRNPLVPIRTGVQMLHRSSDDKVVVPDVLAMMERQTRNIVRLVDELLDFSRIGSGKMTLFKSTVELEPVLRDAVSAMQWQIDEAKHRLTIDIPDEPIYLEADPTRLAQIVINLLANAARYTEPGGAISLGVRRVDNHVRIAVSDTGVGIPREMLGRIFGMYEQADEGTKRSGSGLGIGLTLVKRLVEMHDGTVEARSEGPGKGSEFVVTLPVLGASHTAKRKPQASGARQRR